MKKSLCLLAMVVILASGCVTTEGQKSENSKVWTFNLQQSLARSSGDVAMTMALDQGLDKKDAVGLIEAIIVFVESSDVTLMAFNAKLEDLKAKRPQLAKFVDRINSAVPVGIGQTEQISPETKAILLSFLRDGAIYGATMYKDGMRMKMVAANEGLKN